MESYIDFIKKYNNEKSISSATDSEFNNFLKGGANNIKGGFPPIYMIDTDSDSLREFSPSVDISNILNKKKKNPFLNVSLQDNANGGFLDLFNINNKSDTKSESEKIVKTETTLELPSEITVETINDNQDGGNKDTLFETESSIILPNNIEIIDIIQNGGENLTETSIDLPDELEIVSINYEQKGGNINNLFINNNKKLENEINSTSIDLPNEIEVVTIEKEQIGGDNCTTETSIELPRQLEVVAITNEQVGGNNFSDTSIDLPDELEVVSITNEQEQLGGNNFSDTSIDLPDELEVVSITNEQVGGDMTETSIYLPDELEVVSITNNQIGGDITETSIDLPNELEVVSISNNQLKDSCGGDEEKKLIGGNFDNIFLKNVQSDKNYISNVETSIDLPDVLEIETNKDMTISEETSLYLPNELEVISKA